MYLTKDIHFKSLQLLSSPPPPHTHTLGLPTPGKKRNPNLETKKKTTKGKIQAHEVSNPRVIREFQIGNQTKVHRRYRYNSYEHDEETNEETTEKVVFFKDDIQVE